MNILTWFWKQENARCEYTVQHVNDWANMVRDNTTVDVDICCVTDCPEGLESWIKIIEPPKDFNNIKSERWSEGKGLPQCYRRLAMFAPWAGKVFGDRFMAMDIDCVITGNLDHLLTRAEDFLMFRGTSKKRPYNGSLIIMNAGARPQVYKDFTQEKAEIASRVYLGSDQSWISHCLGPGEIKIGERDGVYAYCPRFVRTNGGFEAFKPPSDLCILFFPGTTKVFKTGAWRASEMEVDLVQKCFDANYDLLAYDPRRDWGKLFCKSNPTARMISGIDEVTDNSRVFVRLDQQREERGKSKGFIKACAEKGIETLPTAREAEWYDDKVKQMSVLSNWLPVTHYITDEASATRTASRIDYPFISKSTDGASSASVRIIRNAKEAMAEISAVFAGGIKSTYERTQQGYVYWQEIVKNNPCDYRVVVTGEYVFGLVRNNRKGTIFASGSGDNYPLVLATGLERSAALAAVRLSKGIGTRWMAYDFVFDGDKNPKVLEMSSAWMQKAYNQCPLFTHQLQDTGSKADRIFEVAGDIIKGGLGLLPDSGSRPGIIAFYNQKRKKIIRVVTGSARHDRFKNDRSGQWEQIK